ncbi:MAG: hypothetical protein ACFBQW_04760 [Sphingomonadaceae bacterium]
MTGRACSLVLLAVISLAACATVPGARLYSPAELAEVARACAVPLGEVVQWPEEPRLLFLFPVEREAQFICVQDWAHSRGLHLAYIEQIVWEE